MCQMTVREIQSESLGHCLQINYDDMEVIVTLDYGPRIVSAAKSGQPNLIYHSVDSVWHRCYGHKMKIALEKSTNEMYLDNSAVMYTVLEDGVRFVQAVLDPLPLELSMDIVFGSEIGSLMTVHRVTNKSASPIKLAIYTETPLLFDGFVFMPLSNVTENGKPTKILNLWNNARWNDPRLFIGENYLSLRGNEALPRLKIGSNNTAGWCGYIGGFYSFIKYYVHNRSALYPFSQCSSYAVAKQHYMSIQTSSPFYRIEPAATALHAENWIFPYSAVNCSPDDEKALDSFINSF